MFKEKLARVLVAAAAAMAAFAGTVPAKAQTNKMSLTVIPPFFQLALNPGESWNSSVKVVNANNYDLPIYAMVMDFKAEGDEGRGKLTPIVGSEAEELPNTLSSWIKISSQPVPAPREKTVEMPFTVTIPEDAQPGGHYAAILIGTKPLDQKKDGPTIEVASYISTLLFIRVAGDVVEKGDIREFASAKSFYQSPDIDFVLRFQNDGNVHLQPQGEIKILNMWGRERGRIEVNQKTSFGYVLPGSTRRFVFNWKGEGNFLEAGRYKAVATLTFGQDAKQNVTSSVYFWIIPLKPVAAAAGILLLFFLAVTWSIKAYVRRALQAEGVYGKAAPARSRAQKGAYKPAGRGLLPFLFIVLAVAGILGLAYYFNQVLKSEREYEITVQKNDGTKKVVPKGGGNELVEEDEPFLEVLPAGQNSKLQIGN